MQKFVKKEGNSNRSDVVCQTPIKYNLNPFSTFAKPRIIFHAFQMRCYWQVFTPEKDGKHR